MILKPRIFLLIMLLTGLAGCIPGSFASVPGTVYPTPTLLSQFSSTKIAVSLPTSSPTQPKATPPSVKTPTAYFVTVDVKKNVHLISPLIYGVSGASIEVLKSLNPGLNSWGGNPSTRYNWNIGHAWNSGSDWEYRNGNYGTLSGSASDTFVSETESLGGEVRISVPTLGWVARDDNNNTCSFPLPGGGCGTANKASCENPTQKADPKLANVQSDPESVANWIRHLKVDKGFRVSFVAMDNEPELWGYSHFDVHPTCTTYQEILDKYLTYSKAVHEVSPATKLVGPTTCCWNYYWNSAAGNIDKVKNMNQDFLPWFLDNLSAQDKMSGSRSLDVLDIHFYPEGLYNDTVDKDTSARRLRNTRSLWDPSYVDESWINQPIMLIPRLKKLIDEHYPGTLLGISEWNWGADHTLNGALAIADVLGIFGRENLYYAAYWMYPPLDSPGSFAFRIYTNYDGKGSRFGDTSVDTASSDISVVGSYAAIDSKTGKLHLMLINKNPETATKVQMKLNNFLSKPDAEVYMYSQSNLNKLQLSTVPLTTEDNVLTLPPYSISLVILSPNP
jgi:hypothetical protein